MVAVEIMREPTFHPHSVVMRYLLFFSWKFHDHPMRRRPPPLHSIRGDHMEGSKEVSSPPARVVSTEAWWGIKSYFYQAVTRHPFPSTPMCTHLPHVSGG